MIAPIDPVLFGEPLPSSHPWASPLSRLGWEVGGARSHLLNDGGGCTVCRRGVPRCTGLKMRVASNFYRATCARCIRTVMYADGRFDAVARIEASLRGRDREMRVLRLARAIGWWRMCGAVATRAPEWLDGFFVPADRNVFHEEAPRA